MSPRSVAVLCAFRVMSAVLYWAPVPDNGGAAA